MSAWTDVDLTDVVEQVAATVWDQQKPPEIAWDRVNDITRHNAREAVLPFVAATRDALAPDVQATIAQAQAEALREAADEFAVIPHPYEGGVTGWLRDRADRIGGTS